MNHPLEWFQYGAGIDFIDDESEEVASLLPKLYGYHLVFVGEPGLTQIVNTSSISHRILINPKAKAQKGSLSNLVGEMDAIPLRNDSVDVVVLSHALEQSSHPHEVLRESHRILIPEGHLIITGFNPFSMWGLWHSTLRLRGKIRPVGKLLSPSRIRDWLTLLNFQIVGGRMFYFRPPMAKARLHQKLHFLEKWGEYCWPIFGGAYTLLAVKRVIPLTPHRVKRLYEKPLWQPASEGMPKPTTTVTKVKTP